VGVSASAAAVCAGVTLPCGAGVGVRMSFVPPRDGVTLPCGTPVVAASGVGVSPLSVGSGLPVSAAVAITDGCSTNGAGAALGRTAVG